MAEVDGRWDRGDEDDFFPWRKSGATGEEGEAVFFLLSSPSMTFSHYDDDRYSDRDFRTGAEAKKSQILLIIMNLEFFLLWCGCSI